MILKLTNTFHEQNGAGSILNKVLADVGEWPGGLVAFYWDHQQAYLPGDRHIRLMTLAYKTPELKQPRLVISDQLELAGRWLETEHPAASAEEQLDHFADYCSAPVIRLDAPLHLDPVLIPKPWGREIWYTGIEARGQSGVGDKTNSIPLPWLLALAGDVALGKDCLGLNLLKILDPLPEPVYGDLYFELHEQKREVYVVTHIDNTAWPQGVGAIRYGFDQRVHGQYDCDADFREAFRQSVARYERVRREIDGHYDAYRKTEGLALDEPVAADRLQRWARQLPQALVSQEQEAREAMNDFTQLRPLSVGDVIKVPCLLPHSLQHGVRTVEFQSPVYERKILSFAQKVLTQNHWDSDEAIALMSTEEPVEAPLEVLEANSRCCLERVVEFDDFQVERLTLAPGAEWRLISGEHYALVMAVNALILAGCRLDAEEAAWIPAAAESVVIENPGSEPVIVLISRPVM